MIISYRKLINSILNKLKRIHDILYNGKNAERFKEKCHNI